MFKLSREMFSVLTLGPNIYSTLKQLASQMYMYKKALRTLKTTLFPAVPTSKEFNTTKKSWDRRVCWRGLTNFREGTKSALESLYGDQLNYQFI